MVKEEEKQKVRDQGRGYRGRAHPGLAAAAAKSMAQPSTNPRDQGTREKLRKMLREGKIDERFVEIEMSSRPCR